LIEPLGVQIERVAAHKAIHVARCRVLLAMVADLLSIVVTTLQIDRSIGFDGT